VKRIKLKQFRIGLDYTQEEMAEILRVSRVQYAQIENGRQLGKQQFWCNLQNAFDIPDSEMWELMKRRED
jgi:DNA-binding XRE family transcriptional regulator